MKTKTVEAVKLLEGKPFKFSNKASKVTLIASRFPEGDGTASDVNPRNSLLYRTQGGRYFISHQTTAPNEMEALEPVSLERAQQLYTELGVQAVDWFTAFPPASVSNKIEDA